MDLLFKFFQQKYLPHPLAEWQMTLCKVTKINYDKIEIKENQRYI